MAAKRFPFGYRSYGLNEGVARALISCINHYPNYVPHNDQDKCMSVWKKGGKTASVHGLGLHNPSCVACVMRS